MPKSVFELREGKQVSNMSLREICDYKTMTFELHFYRHQVALSSSNSRPHVPRICYVQCRS
jgi:hypothetical protein